MFRVLHPSWWSPTVPDLYGVDDSYRILPLVVLFSAAVVCAVLATTRPRFSMREIPAAVVALAGWGVILTQGDHLGDALRGLLVVLVVLVVAGLLRRAGPAADARHSYSSASS